MGDYHTTFGEDELDIPQAEAEQVIQTHCVSDDLARNRWRRYSDGSLVMPILSLTRFRLTMAINLAMPRSPIRRQVHYLAARGPRRHTPDKPDTNITVAGMTDQSATQS